MKSDAKTPDEYVKQLPADRQQAIAELRKVVLKNLPKGFEEIMSYGMLGYVVPHKMYPDGYHCNPKLPLPFLNIASQKNFIAIYHMGLYSNKELKQWFVDEYKKQSKKKLDLGKSCMKFKKAEDIPYKLIGELAKKITPKMWIEYYENTIKK